MAFARPTLPRSRWIAKALAALAAGALVGGATLAAASGCTSQLPPEPPKPCDKQIVTLDLWVGGDVNPNENANPRPCVVRLYQLASELKLENARYDDILLDAENTLGKDIIKV